MTAPAHEHPAPVLNGATVTNYEAMHLTRCQEHGLLVEYAPRLVAFDKRLVEQAATDPEPYMSVEPGAITVNASNGTFRYVITYETGRIIYTARSDA